LAEACPVYFCVNSSNKRKKYPESKLSASFEFQEYPYFPLAVNFSLFKEVSYILILLKNLVIKRSIFIGKAVLIAD
jgi:hypothetical protein